MSNLPDDLTLRLKNNQIELLNKINENYFSRNDTKSSNMTSKTENDEKFNNIVNNPDSRNSKLNESESQEINKFLINHYNSDDKTKHGINHIPYINKYKINKINENFEDKKESIFIRNKSVEKTIKDKNTKDFEASEPLFYQSNNYKIRLNDFDIPLIKKFNKTLNNSNSIDVLKDDEKNQYCYEKKNNDITMSLIEKDRMIFEISKVLKDTKIENENIKTILEKKENNIIKLSSENKSLNAHVLNLNNKYNEKLEEFRIFRENHEEKLTKLLKDLTLFEEKKSELTISSEESASENNRLNLQNKKLENELTNLKKEIKNKEELTSKYEKKLEDFKKELLIISSLKKKNSDLERINSDLTYDLANEKNINTKLIVNQKIENQIEKDECFNLRDKKEFSNINQLNLLQNHQKLVFDYENLKRDYNEKIKELKNLDEKYNKIFLENDNFVKFFSKEIFELNNMFEECPNFHTKKMNNNFKPFFLSSKRKLKDSSNVDLNNFNLQFDILQKNFDMIISNFETNYNENFDFYIKLSKTNSEFETKIRELTLEKDSLFNECTLCIQKTEELKENLYKIESEKEKLFENFKNLNYQNLKINSENDELRTILDLWKHERNSILLIISEKIHFLYSNYDFLLTLDKSSKDSNKKDLKVKSKFNSENSLNIENSREMGNDISLLKENYIENINDSLLSEKIALSDKFSNFTEKLISELLKLFELNKQLNLNIEILDINIKKINEEKELLDKRIDRIVINKEEEIEKIKKSANEDLENFKSSYIGQMNQLNITNKKNSILINSFENQVKVLSEKNTKYENNLRLLTGSHKELEKSIHNNFNILSNELEEKENKYNCLLRENEIKEAHLKSLENIVIRKNVNNMQNEEENNYEIMNENDYKSSEQPDFLYDTKNEEALNTIVSQHNNYLLRTGNISNFSGSINNRDKPSDFTILNSFNFFEEKKNKIPGRIYSLKYK